MSVNARRSDAQSPYRWVVVAVSATVNLLAWSVRSTFAVFYVALLGEFAWRRGEAAIGYSLSWLLLLVFSPLAGCTTAGEPGSSCRPAGSFSAWPLR
jgi:hypothetical protein